MIFTEFFYYLVDIPIILCGLLCLCSWRCASLGAARPSLSLSPPPRAP